MTREEFCLLCGVVLTAGLVIPAAANAQSAAAPASGYAVTCDPVVADGAGVTTLNCQVSGTGIVTLEGDATLVGSSPKSVMTIAVDGQPCAQPAQASAAAAKIACRSVYVKNSKVHIVLQHAGATVAADSMKLYAAPLP